MLSILRTTLKREPRSSFTLVCANKGVGTIMFREDLEDLKNLHLERFNVIHILGTDAQEIELFASARPGRSKRKTTARAAAGTSAETRIAVTLDGATRTVSAQAGQSLLDAALAADIDAPFACKAGVCSTCRCRVLEGEVEMAVNHALEDYEVEKGYVLSCQAVPVGDRVRIDYDQ